MSLLCSSEEESIKQIPALQEVEHCQSADLDIKFLLSLCSAHSVTSPSKPSEVDACLGYRNLCLCHFLIPLV